MSTQSNDVLARALPWRHITPAHREFGARSIRGTVTLAGTIGTIATLFDAPYNLATIDRIIGVRLNIENASRQNGVAFHVQDRRANWRLDFSSAVMLGIVQFNAETLVDASHLELVNDAALAVTFDYSLYNVEVVPHVMAG